MNKEPEINIVFLASRSSASPVKAKSDQELLVDFIKDVCDSFGEIIAPLTMKALFHDRADISPDMAAHIFGGIHSLFNALISAYAAKLQSGGLGAHPLLTPQFKACPRSQRIRVAQIYAADIAADINQKTLKITVANDAEDKNLLATAALTRSYINTALAYLSNFNAAREKGHDFTTAIRLAAATTPGLGAATIIDLPSKPERVRPTAPRSRPTPQG